jgi:hypothetical protein
MHSSYEYIDMYCGKSILFFQIGSHEFSFEFLHGDVLEPGGYREMSSILADQERALVYEPKCSGKGGVPGSQPMNTAVHRSPNKLWRSDFIFNL